MKLILDTNVLVSGIFFGGVPGQILTAWADDKVSLVLSPAILDEYVRVGAELAAKHSERRTALVAVLDLITVNATIVNATPLPTPVSVDPADDVFLAAATSSGTRLIVSGDRHLLDISGWQGIEVVKPREFFDRYIR